MLLKLLKKIPPAKLKQSLSFLHRHHVDRLFKYMQYYFDRHIELELLWRVAECLDIRNTEFVDNLRK